MIGWLSGIVRDIDPAGLLLLETTAGVGYEVHVSLFTLGRFQPGDRAELSIHTHVREDQITLFGFDRASDRALFRQLNTVSGIGARMALNLMSGLSPDELKRAIEHGDIATISRTPGIGKKTAQRLVLELKGKLVDAEPQSPANANDQVRQDVHSALVNLGYKAQQVERVLNHLDDDAFEPMLRAALKLLG
ncbi:MAG: Holliday junction branch migration protein RuvA [Zetaproteobacteria bacterium]|nr:MAG: Holliday junction branch migration protein RuvA [Zetaproteobacteria bacterium]